MTAVPATDPRIPEMARAEAERRRHAYNWPTWERLDRGARGSCTHAARYLLAEIDATTEGVNA